MTTQTSAQFDPKSKELICRGKWNLESFASLKNELQKITWPKSGEILVNGKDISEMDTAGALLLSHEIKNLSSQHVQIQFHDFSEQHQKLLSLVKSNTPSEKPVSEADRQSIFEKVGRYSMASWQSFTLFLDFVGKLWIETAYVFTHPAHIRLREMASVIRRHGYDALPIITLLSFMIGIVIAYQMGVQLRNYGANIFIVDLLGLSVLREFGPMLTAIMIAGRTGSSFTAQLGTMQVNREIDALNTMGVTPGELLLLPRIFGLFIALPLLTIWADVFGVLGGMIMANNMLDVTWGNFLTRFQQQVPLRSLIMGLGKAPVFALIIGSIGCFEGMQVRGSADSVGRQTTRSVVLSIFFIIVADALFSILFSKLKL